MAETTAPESGIVHVKLGSFSTRTGTFTRWAIYQNEVEVCRTTQWDDDPPDGGGPAVSLKEAA